MASAVSSPDDRLGEAVAELRSSVAAELLETLSSVSPSFFETIVLDLASNGLRGSRAVFSELAAPAKPTSTGPFLWTNEVGVSARTVRVPKIDSDY